MESSLSQAAQGPGSGKEDLLPLGNRTDEEGIEPRWRNIGRPAAHSIGLASDVVQPFSHLIRQRAASSLDKSAVTRGPANCPFPLQSGFRHRRLLDRLPRTSLACACDIHDQRAAVGAFE